jgi:hypothetical protein
MGRLAASLVGLGLAAHVAAAQPITHTDACRVVVVLAPDDVRAEIEAWVRAEPKCTRELEVRVVPTDAGLYLQTRDADGIVRERVVPDAEGAALLVVSWMADDSLAEVPPIEASPDAARTSAPYSARQDGDRDDTDDDRGDDDDDRDPTALGLAARATAGRSSPRSVMVGALAGDELGVRGQIDLLAGRRLSLGLAAGYLDETAQLRVVGAATWSAGRLGLRLQLGAGADVGDVERMDMDARARPVIEAAALGTVRLSSEWGLVGGPVIEASPSAARVSGFLGVRRGL